MNPSGLDHIDTYTGEIEAEETQFVVKIYLQQQYILTTDAKKKRKKKKIWLTHIETLCCCH